MTTWWPRDFRERSKKSRNSVSGGFGRSSKCILAHRLAYCADQHRYALIASSSNSDVAVKFEQWVQDVNRILAKREQEAREREGRPFEDGDATPKFEVTVCTDHSEPIASEVGAVIVRTDVGNKRAVVRYDTHFRLNRLFHIEIQWHEAMASLVNTFVDSLKKRAESKGFRLVPTPILLEEQSSDTSDRPNPYHGVSRISFSFVPQEVSGATSKLLQERGVTDHSRSPKFGSNPAQSVPSDLQLKVLEKFHYLFEIEISSMSEDSSIKRFMHESGNSFIHVVDHASFEWYPNPLLVDIRRRPDDATPDNDGELLAKLRQFCSDNDKLRGMWYDL